MTPVRKRFSISRFILMVGLQFSGLLLAGIFLSPKLWAHQLSTGLLALSLTIVGTVLFTCFFEWGFHRYVLHGIIHPWLIRFARGHRHHHALTPIKLGMIVTGSNKRIVLNRYPITEVAQYEDATFPPYALLAFWVIYTPLLLIVQLFLPHYPILLGGYTGITMGMLGYEVFHATEHLPYEWWKRATEHPRFGMIWRRIYGFHHFHHANVGANEAISGFFGLPIADWVFGTYHQPRELLLHDRLATAIDFAVKPPRGLIVRIDQWARRRETTIRRKYPELFQANE